VQQGVLSLQPVITQVSLRTPLPEIAKQCPSSIIGVSSSSFPYQIFFKMNVYQIWTPPKGGVIALVAREFIRWASGNIIALTHELVPVQAEGASESSHRLESILSVFPVQAEGASESSHRLESSGEEPSKDKALDSRWSHWPIFYLSPKYLGYA
jgi:hypothetical protein